MPLFIHIRNHIRSNFYWYIGTCLDLFTYIAKSWKRMTKNNKKAKISTKCVKKYWILLFICLFRSNFVSFWLLVFLLSTLSLFNESRTTIYDMSIWIFKLTNSLLAKKLLQLFSIHWDPISLKLIFVEVHRFLSHANSCKVRN